MDQLLNPITEDSWAKELFAITLFVEDLTVAKAFYKTVFSLTAVFEDPNSTVFKIGQTHINLLKITAADELIHPAKVADREAGARMVFTVHVEDVDAMCDHLKRLGVSLLNGPMDRPWGIRTASFLDPAGNIWEIAK